MKIDIWCFRCGDQWGITFLSDTAVIWARARGNLHVEKDTVVWMNYESFLEAWDAISDTSLAALVEEEEKDPH